MGREGATYDIILYGATGFTGKLTARYLDSVSELAGRRWAIAGRTRASLEALKATLSSPTVDVVCVQLTDSDEVAAMVASARVVISCAGPWSTMNGENLLGECARQGVDYSDLSGESFWQREMVEKYGPVAEKSGAKIVLGGGVDSVPSDLGTYMALAALSDTISENCEVKVHGVCTEFSGTISGGSFATARANRKATKAGTLTEDPYILAPGAATGIDSKMASLSGMPPDFKWSWSGVYGILLPFFMGPINAPVVRRSLVLSGVAHRVSYAECMSIGMTFRMLWLFIRHGFGYPLGQPIDWKPKAGGGPPPWVIRGGAFTFEVTATAASGLSARATISEQRGDPGYGGTAKILSEVALCMAFDRASTPARGGVLTPSTAMGDALVQRLQRHPDMRLEVSRL